MQNNCDGASAKVQARPVLIWSVWKSSTDLWEPIIDDACVLIQLDWGNVVVVRGKPAEWDEPLEISVIGAAFGTGGHGVRHSGGGGTDFSGYIGLKILDASEAPVSGPSSDCEGLVAFIEKDGDLVT